MSLENTDSNLTYLFELMTSENRVVVSHTHPRIVCHGARRNDTGSYIDLEKIREYHPTWKIVQTYPLNSLDECLKAVETLNPLQTEGYVVVDHRSHRIKIKSPKYVLIHHAKDGLSTRRMIQIALSGEKDEVLTYFPELQKEFLQVDNLLDQLICRIDHDVWSFYGGTQKEFALAISHLPWSGILFALRAEKISTVKEGLQKMPVQKVERLLKLLDVN